MENIPGLEVIPLGWCIEAMYRAVERVRTTGWNDPVGAYAAVAETLFWIDVVDKQLRKYRHHYEATLAAEQDDVGRMLRGLLFARNRITHEVDEIGYIIAMCRTAICQVGDPVQAVRAAPRLAGCPAVGAPVVRGEFGDRQIGCFLGS